MRFLKVLNCCFFIPHRIYVCIIAFLGLTICYIMRFSFSMAMTEMVQAPPIPEDPNACPYQPGHGKNVTKKKLEFQWTEYQQGITHSSFFWGYALTQVPGGMLAERIGAKPVLTIFVGLTSIGCALTPIITRTFDFIGLILLRITIGLAQGFVYASLHLVVANWVPKQERGTWGTVVFSGAHAGNTLNNLFTGLMLSWFPGNWPVVFYVWASLGALWTIVFSLTTYAFPTDYKDMSEKEAAILTAYLDETSRKEKAANTPWKSIMTSLPVWAIIVAMIGHDWGLFALVTDVPKFMKSVLHFHVKNNGYANAMTFFSMWLIAIFSGLTVDLLQRKQYLKRIHSRKICTTIASVGPSLGLLGSVYSGCNVIAATISLILGMSTMGFFYPSLKVNPIDLSVNYAGTLGALGHGIGAISGIIVPYLIGYLTPNSYMEEWRLVFWITFGVMSLTNIFYIIFASADLQPWNTPKEKEEKSEDPKVRIT
ncbi:putative inorganic phosphate cotransporter [Rhodnius prolixus]|uniref:Putative inorganic phosphate cotransporter lygus hesperus n=1 Tax=Rhodnius prolixus TaxID=13249 RepID=A0A4P6DF48_RHOPR